MNFKDAMKLKQAIDQYRDVIVRTSLEIEQSCSDAERDEIREEQDMIRDALHVMIDRLTSRW